MKKIIGLIVAAMLIVSLFAGCAPKDTGDISSIPVSQGESDFEAPENYASVVLVTINPQFRFYLDANGVVLAVEPVNADAKTINKNVTFKSVKIEDAVKNLIVAANDGGFIKADATVDIKVKSNDGDKKATEILDKVKLSVKTKLGEIKVEATVTATVSDDALTEEENKFDTDVSDDKNFTHPDIENKDPNSPNSSEKEDNNQTTPPSSDKNPNSTDKTPPKDEGPAACNHTKTRAVPVSTGKNIIDSSKLDVAVHNVVCATCAKVLKTENHTVVGERCTICRQSNFATKTSGFIDAGPTLEDDARINDDGSVVYDIMVGSSWHSAAKPEYAIDEWHYKIPEAAMLEAIRTKFVITDAQFEALKAQGKYEFFIDQHTYNNGYFEIVDPAAGGPGFYSHTAVGYKDDKNGNFTLYVDYIQGGADVEESQRKHLYYYAVEYSYSGYSNLSVIKGDYYEQISGFAPVVDSMRVKAIKKVSALPSNMIKVK